jgi:hypothetical protein
LGRPAVGSWKGPNGLTKGGIPVYIGIGTVVVIVIIVIIILALRG